jgi:hypothetical protein
LRYLRLVHHDEDELATRPARGDDALVGATLAYRDGRRRGGHYLAPEAPHPADTATTIRVRGGRVPIADGHHAARDLNEVVRWRHESRHTLARTCARGITPAGHHARDPRPRIRSRTNRISGTE